MAPKSRNLEYAIDLFLMWSDISETVTTVAARKIPSKISIKTSLPNHYITVLRHNNINRKVMI